MFLAAMADDREVELRSCLQQIEVQRASQLAACHAFQAHVAAEIDRLHGMRADVQRRAAALDEMYSLAAEQLTKAFVEASGVVQAGSGRAETCGE